MPTPRVTASDKVRCEIDALFADPDRELGEILEQVATLSVRLVFQAALEAEVTEFLGRDELRRAKRRAAATTNEAEEPVSETHQQPVTKPASASGPRVRLADAELLTLPPSPSGAGGE